MPTLRRQETKELISAEMGKYREMVDFGFMFWEGTKLRNGMCEVMVCLEGQEAIGLKRDWPEVIQIDDQECRVWRRKGLENDEEELLVALAEQTAAKKVYKRR